MKLKEAHYADVRNVEMAMAYIRRGRDLLAKAGAEQAAKAVRKALKSVEGAKRHVDRRFHHATYGSHTPYRPPSVIMISLDELLNGVRELNRDEEAA